jgi:serine/threonine protein kinase
MSCRNVAGTPTYMAPEVWNRQTGKASDVWAIGLILWEILFGALPGQIRMSTYANIGRNVALFNSPPGKLFSDPAWLGVRFQDPERIKGILYWALHPDPAHRIDAGTLLYAIEDMVQVEYGRMSPRTALPYSPPSSANDLVKFKGCTQVDDGQALFMNDVRPIQPRVALPSNFR